MLSPILRLLATYLAVALAVFAFFNRDRLAEMMGWQGRDAPALAAPAAPQGTAAPVSPPPESSGPAAPVFAPPPGENGVPDMAQAPATPVPPAPAPALQTPTPPASPTTGAALQVPSPPPAAAAPAQPLVRPTGGLAGAPSAQTPPTNGFEQQIAAARAAYWQGDVPTAIARYRELLAQYPDNESLHGELGNIYYMNGNRVEAATHFEAAGMAALKAGRPQQAQMLLGVLGALDRAAAARLQTAMEGSE